MRDIGKSIGEAFLFVICIAVFFVPTAIGCVIGLILMFLSYQYAAVAVAVAGVLVGVLYVALVLRAAL